MELGRAIVDQLEIDHRGEVLDKWMAHHLAELIKAAETSEGKARQEAEDRAVELILKLWANRRALPGAADPVKGYRNAINVLAAMFPSGDPWRYYRRGHTAEKLLHEMFGAMVHLVMSGLLLTRNLELRTIQDAEWDALSAEERLLVEILNTWHEFFVTPAPNKVELENFYRILVEGETDTEKAEEEAAGDGNDESNPAEIDRAAILSHVETFQARLDQLVTQWRETMTHDHNDNIEDFEN